MIAFLKRLFMRPKPIVNKAKPEHKLSLIDARKYRDEGYTAFWEIATFEGDPATLAKAAKMGVPVSDRPGPWNWVARIYSRKDTKILHESSGIGNTEEDVRRASQVWVLSLIEKYKPISH